MNQRLQELLQQSTEDILGVPIVNQKKFAELIVAECIEVFSKDLPKEGDGKMLEVVNRVCNVAEHFGVE